ncbi:hypothetical protein [Phocaeicola plebeius]|uniref:hypothetical protein n=1 Tax=Phocaeicola plebeius TaxID=310297 RepID=UPI0020132B1A|nr:hypothetical protein [Phocaeicola plebeius]MCL1614548.1 hypothetical protein [Phocaeicola plebeius]
MKKVDINGKEHVIKYSLRCLFKFEQLFGHPYQGKTSEENYQLLHAALFAYNQDYSMTFDELIDECDNNPGIFLAFQEEMSDASRRLMQYFEDKKKVEATTESQ